MKLVLLEWISWREINTINQMLFLIYRWLMVSMPKYLRNFFVVGTDNWKPRKFKTWLSIFNTCNVTFVMSLIHLHMHWQLDVMRENTPYLITYGLLTTVNEIFQEIWECKIGGITKRNWSRDGSHFSYVEGKLQNLRVMWFELKGLKAKGTEVVLFLLSGVGGWRNAFLRWYFV